MKGHIGGKILMAALAGILIFYQIYSAVYKPISTESAVFYTADDGLQITGILIRNEHVIENSNGGVLHFETADGSRVAKGGVIASIYNNASDSVNVTHLAELEAQIKDIEEIEGYNNLQASDMDLATNRVNEALSEFVYNCSAGDFSSVYEDGAKYLSAVNRKQVIAGQKHDFSEKLSSLRKERDEIASSLSSPKGTIKSEESSGYFVSVVDGYEEVLSTDSLNSLTPEKLDNLKPKQSPKNAIGKIVSDYDWYIAAKISLNDSHRYKIDDSLIIKTADKTADPLAVTVKQINISEKSSQAVVIFSCQQMNSSLASMREGVMTVISKEYSGLRVNKKALRVVKGETGVYVLSGINIKFLPVTVIYTGDEYVICEQTKENGDNILRLYDRVVVKGRNLYDGKVVG